MRALTFLSGASVGAGLMYLMDPERGDRRRAELRDTLNDLREHEMVGRAVEAAQHLDMAGMLERPARMLERSGVLERPARMLERSGMLERPGHWWSRAVARPEVRRGADELRRRAESMGLRRRRRTSRDTGDWMLLGGLI